MGEVNPGNLSDTLHNLFLTAWYLFLIAVVIAAIGAIILVAAVAFWGFIEEVFGLGQPGKIKREAKERGKRAELRRLEASILEKEALLGMIPSGLDPDDKDDRSLIWYLQYRNERKRRLEEENQQRGNV